jgi:hypothetical protein
MRIAVQTHPATDKIPKKKFIPSLPPPPEDPIRSLTRMPACDTDLAGTLSEPMGGLVRTAEAAKALYAIRR